MRQVTAIATPLGRSRLRHFTILLALCAGLLPTSADARHRRCSHYSARNNCHRAQCCPTACPQTSDPGSAPLRTFYDAYPSYSIGWELQHCLHEVDYLDDLMQHLCEWHNTQRDRLKILETTVAELSAGDCHCPKCGGHRNEFRTVDERLDELTSRIARAEADLGDAKYQCWQRDEGCKTEFQHVSCRLCALERLSSRPSSLAVVAIVLASIALVLSLVAFIVAIRASSFMLAATLCLLAAGQARADWPACWNATAWVGVPVGGNQVRSGTGVVFEEVEGEYHLLTNAHVVGADEGRPQSRVRVQFFIDGWPSETFPGTLRWHAYDERAGRDMAIVAVARTGSLIEHPPGVVPLGDDAAANDTLFSVGCGKGQYPTAFVGHVVGFDERSAMFFTPPPANGRSGSAMFDARGEHVVGLLTFRTKGDRAGGAISVSEIRRAMAGENARPNPGPPQPGSNDAPVRTAQRVPVQMPGPVEYRPAQCGPDGCDPRGGGDPYQSDPYLAPQGGGPSGPGNYAPRPPSGRRPGPAPPPTPSPPPAAQNPNQSSADTDRLRSALADAKAQLESVRADMQAKIEALATERDGLHGALAGLTKVKDDLAAQRDQARGDAANSQGIIEKLRGHVVGLEKLRDDLAGQRDGLKDQVGQLVAQGESAAAAAANTAGRAWFTNVLIGLGLPAGPAGVLAGLAAAAAVSLGGALWKRQTSALKKQLAEANGPSDTLKAAAAEANTALVAVRREAAAKLDALRGQLDATRADATSAQGESDAAQTQITSLKSLNERLAAQRDALQTRISELVANAAEPILRTETRIQNRIVPYETNRHDQAWRDAIRATVDKYPGAANVLRFVERLKSDIFAGQSVPQEEAVPG